MENEYPEKQGAKTPPDNKNDQPGSSPGQSKPSPDSEQPSPPPGPQQSGPLPQEPPLSHNNPGGDRPHNPNAQGGSSAGGANNTQNPNGTGGNNATSRQMAGEHGMAPPPHARDLANSGGAGGGKDPRSTGEMVKDAATQAAKDPSGASSDVKAPKKNDKRAPNMNTQADGGDTAIRRAAAAASDDRDALSKIRDEEGASGKAAKGIGVGLGKVLQYGGLGSVGQKLGEGATSMLGKRGTLIAAAAVMAPALIPAVLIMGLVVIMVAVFAGGIANTTSAIASGETTAGGTHVQIREGSSQVLNEVKLAGAHWDVPWTVIAAVGESATELGKYSPYDTIDRDPARAGSRRGSAGAIGTIGEDGTPSIVGPSTLTITQIMEYWEGTGRGQPPRLQAPIREVMETYLRESDAEGIRGDFVIAQAIAETGHFSNTDTSINNFAGIAHYDHATSGQAFASVEQGIRAHVQLLKKYVGGNDVALRHEDVSPRAGASSSTWGGLAGTWATDRTYWDLLRGVYRSMGGNVDDNAQSTAGQVGNALSSLESSAAVVVGDGLCVGIGGDHINTALRTANYTPKVNCGNGRKLKDGAALIRELADDDTRAVVVALGTSDARENTTPESLSAALDDIISAAAGLPVLVVEVFGTSQGADTVNNEFRKKAGERAVVSTISLVSAIPSSALAANGITLNEEGLLARAQAIAQGVKQADRVTSAGAWPGNPEGLEVSDFPVVIPAIGGEDPKEGLGPYLIEPGAASAAGINAQSVEFSRGEVKTGTDFIASRLSEIRFALEREGWDRTKDQDFFWTEAVRRLPVLDPRGAECTLGDRIVAGNDEEKRGLVNAEIRYVWQCELAGSGIETLVGIDKIGEEYTNTVTGSEQIDLLIGEAVRVATLFSDSGVAACDDSADLAGVFPLTRETFETYADGEAKNRGRCDAAANIQTAARAFVAGERTRVGSRGDEQVDDRKTVRGKVFPTKGTANYIDDFGAPRAASNAPCKCQEGIDLTVGQDTEVVAIESGTVFVADEGILLHGDSGTVYQYGNVDPVVSRNGNRVRAGGKVATAGSDPVNFIMRPGGRGSLAENPKELLDDLKNEVTAPTIAGTPGTIGDRTTELGPYAPMVGGWWAMPWVLGDENARRDFFTNGPTSTWTPNAECRAAMDTWILAGGSFPAGDACVGRDGYVVSWAILRGQDAIEQLEAQYEQEPSNQRIDIGRVTRDNRTKVAVDIRDRLASVRERAMTPGQDNILPRFSDQATSSIPAGGQLAASRAGASDYPNLVVELAVNLGGIFPGDNRYTEVSDPYEVLSAFSAPRPGGSEGGVVDGSIPFAQEFNEAGAEVGIDPRMLAAVAFVESSFNQDIIDCKRPSSAGALGLMQFMPATAAGMGVDPCDPVSAIKGAARLLKGHYERFGTWELAWAAYNAGGGAVQRFGGVPPYTETQNYVVKVAAKWEEYKQASPSETLPTGPDAPSGPTSASGFIWPTAGAITSGYGPRWGTFHYGLDIGAPTGTPVYAVKDGTVSFAGWQGGYGNFVIVDHGGGVVTRYGHLSQFASSAGQPVRQGQLIAYVGSTGDSTGPHLHFEVRINGGFQDPLPYLP